MKQGIRLAIGLIGFLSLVPGSTALADSVFVIEDPPVDFEVIDAEPFDGAGDNGPYATFNDALFGTIGEARSTAEFDLSPFGVPPGASIVAATLAVRITDVDVFGLGVDGETPAALIVDGYVGDGIAELADFQAGDGNVLDTVATPEPWVGQIVSFDVTAFVAALVDAGETFAGLTVRAGSFGGLMLEEGGGNPQLTIETLLDPTAVGQTNLQVALRLRGNAPNPFAASTRIDYSLPDTGGARVLLTIHDAAGRQIRTLREASQGPGSHSVRWNGADESGRPVPSGVYFCRLRWDGGSEARSLLLLR